MGTIASNALLSKAPELGSRAVIPDLITDQERGDERDGVFLEHFGLGPYLSR